MTLRKLFTLGIILAMFLVVPVAHAAMAVAWDTYTDTKANKLVLLSSLNQTDWAIEVDDIATDSVGATVPSGTAGTRVYYVLIAVDTDPDPDVESGPSNMISYYWTTGGGGTGIQAPGTIKFIDCEDPDISIEDDAICTALGQ